MELFDEMVEEAYKGFGTSSHINLTDLRYMYYGRRDLYVSFTDDGDYFFDGQFERRPDGIIGYAMNDVIGNKVRSPEFYANVFRWQNIGALQDVRRYRADDLYRDYRKLVESGKFDLSLLNELFNDIGRNVLIRHTFKKLWGITEQLAMSTGKDVGKEWAKILMSLGYNLIGDPASVGVLSNKEPTYLILDVDSRIDVDILPIQKFRIDPRLRTKQKVERKLKYMRNARKRIAKHIPSHMKPSSPSFKQQVRDAILAAQELGL